MKFIDNAALILRVYVADTGETELFVTFNSEEQDMPGFVDSFVKQYDDTKWEVQQIHP